MKVLVLKAMLEEFDDDMDVVTWDVEWGYTPSVGVSKETVKIGWSTTDVREVVVIR